MISFAGITVEYSLTPFSQTLIPIISSLGRWVDKNEKKLQAIILKRKDILIRKRS
ncbi:MAG: hypothetical protein HOP08_01085 [Cyclobacteriaceae bacterium]|nr:hypothetical protein [Cyclobacteriaceae bacterium]